jgi:hypothetical protein
MNRLGLRLRVGTAATAHEQRHRDEAGDHEKQQADNGEQQRFRCGQTHARRR